MVTVDYSQIKTWRFCRQAHYYRYVDEIVPRVKNKPLKIGSVIHEVIETWANTGKWKPAVAQIQQEYDHMLEEEKEYYGNIPEAVESMISGYVSRYKPERPNYKLIEAKLGPIPLTKRTQFQMRIDRLTQTKAGLTLCETKTARKIPDEDIRIWDLQTLLYVWGLRQLGYPVKAILWDYIRTKPPTEPAVLKDGTLSKRANIDTDYDTYMRAIERVCPDRIEDYEDILERVKGNTNRFYKRVLLPVSEKMIEPVVKDAKITSLEIALFGDMSPVKHISGYTCPRCFYSSLCHAELKGLDSDFIRKSEYMTKEEESNGHEIEEESED